MKAIFNIAIFAVLLAVAPQVCHAMMEIEEVPKDRAQALGVEVRVNAAGPDAIRVEIEFDAKGELKGYSRVDLEIDEGGKLLAASTLREEQSQKGHVVVSFAADRAKLGEFTVRVVVGHDAVLDTMVGYDIRVKDFVDLGKVH